MSKKLTIGEQILKKSKKHKKQTSKHIVILLVILVCFMIFGNYIYKGKNIFGSLKEDDKLVVTYLGNINLAEKGQKESLSKILSPLKNLTNNSNYTSANLKLSSSNPEKDIKDIKTLSNNNINSLTLGNSNNMNFKNTQSIFKSIDQSNPNLLSDEGINIINNNISKQFHQGKEIATVSFSDTSSKFIDASENNTSIKLNPKTFIPLIKDLDKNNDLVIVRVNWGVPDERTVSERQREYAHALVDAGADVIIGNNNVIQKIESYKDSHIFYSLGNLTSQDFLSKNNESIIVQQEIENEKLKTKVIPVNFKGGYLSNNNDNIIKNNQMLNYIKDSSMDWTTKKGEFINETSK
ncbi:capsule biosynthesis protein CapA [Mammaliicoccus vitulinus]|uniref:Capsule biosynthesis protein CapA n=2 Tax=Mammaliicoccus vitulinus TaxID=71237 RepID=A0A2T4PVG4_9STAP|nr:CapA family protein [Mammaliicoccus vitulinus]PTI30437.1 capsule biosynthesis protein CapA [Mammaliicoccus vitulinus]